MKENGTTDQISFFSEMSEHQVSAREFFGKVLLDSLNRNFGLQDVVISYYDTQGNFLSWINKDGSIMNCETHPYRQFIINDVIRYKIFQDAVRDQLTYFNVKPRLYKSTDVMGTIGYEQSAYVRFLEENFNANYSVTMAFGINAYIQIMFLKDLKSGDFTDEEIEKLNEIYIYIANSYKNFKKYEQARIISAIQSEIIESGEKAYLITDDFMHVMSCNQTAKEYLSDILGLPMTESFDQTMQYSWIPFLLQTETAKRQSNLIHEHTIKDYTLKSCTYDQRYSNGIVDRYHWITLTKKGMDVIKSKTHLKSKQTLTQAEYKIVKLMYQGLTYKDIADELVVSYHTVKKHVQNIYTKCGVKSRFQLCKWVDDQLE